MCGIRYFFTRFTAGPLQRCCIGSAALLFGLCGDTAAPLQFLKG